MFRGMMKRLRQIPFKRPLSLRRPQDEARETAVDVPKILVELDDFKIFVGRDDRLIGRDIATYRKWEPEVSSVLKRLLKPGQVLLDIGANIGFHTLLGARLVGPKGKVIAFEMSGDNCTLLRASIAANGFKHITLHPFAVAEFAQTLSFTLTTGTGNGVVVTDAISSDLGTANWTEARQARAVAVDEVISSGQPVHMIKMDIEGSEFRALCGMTRLLREQRPIILFEFFPSMLRGIGQINPETLLDAIRVFHYDLWHIGEGGKIGLQTLTNAEAIALSVERHHADLIALPR